MNVTEVLTTAIVFLGYFNMIAAGVSGILGKNEAATRFAAYAAMCFGFAMVAR